VFDSYPGHYGVTEELRGGAFSMDITDAIIRTCLLALCSARQAFTGSGPRASSGTMWWLNG
jgi:hypothetical protein